MSTTITIKDVNYRIIGRIGTLSDGSQVAKDVGYRIVGRYDPKADGTKDVNFRIVARENMLAGFFK